MKSVLLIRHAKSSWDFNIEDFERPLNNRGKTDAPAMAQRLLKKEIQIDAFISSPANRAFTTASLFANEYNVSPKDIITISTLYDAAAPVFANVIENLDDRYNSIALFSHNPGITDFVNQLTTTKIDDMPTCAIFAVKAGIEKWKEFNAATKTFWFFDYPKAE